MNICRGGFNTPNKIVRCINDGVKFIAIVYFPILGHDFTIFIPLRFCPVPSRRVFFTMTRFSINKRCILIHSEGCKPESESKALPCALPCSILRLFASNCRWNSSQTNVSTPDCDIRSRNNQMVELSGILSGHPRNSQDNVSLAVSG